MTKMLKSVISTVQLIENMTRREVTPLSMALTSQIYQILWDGQKKIWKTINKKNLVTDLMERIICLDFRMIPYPRKS